MRCTYGTPHKKRAADQRLVRSHAFQALHPGEVIILAKQTRPSQPAIAAFTSEMSFQAFLEAAPDAVVVVDTTGQIVVVNTLTEKIFGFTREELLGRQIEMLVPKRYHKVHVGHRDGYFHDPKTRPMGEGRALSGLRKNGEEFPVEISLSPIRTHQGSWVISIIRDISARRQLEAKFQGLLESAPDGIVVVDRDGKIAIVNSQTEKLFGYTREELIGQPIEILVPERYHHKHIGDRDRYIEHPKTRPMGAGRALMGRRKDGTEIPVEISLSPLETDQGTLVTSIIRDITDRRRAEDQIQASLREKEALLKEIHHRVKNNLQVTSSLLRLQSGHIKSDSIRGEEAREMFAESQNRIRSMALVHEKLYQSSELSRIKFAEYIESLASLLFRSFGVSQNSVELRVNARNIHLSVETAVPCGLMLNELISNCLKHAFPLNRPGRITIDLDRDENGHYRLAVSDDGAGLPKDFDFERTGTLGLQLVRTLSKQLEGSIEVIRLPASGTRFSVTFLEAKSP